MEAKPSQLRYPTRLAFPARMDVPAFLCWRISLSGARLHISCCATDLNQFCHRQVQSQVTVRNRLAAPAAYVNQRLPVVAVRRSTHGFLHRIVAVIGDWMFHLKEDHGAYGCIQAVPRTKEPKTIVPGYILWRLEVTGSSIIFPFLIL